MKGAFGTTLISCEKLTVQNRDARLDFGAQQVILVRDENTRYKLRQLLGSSGLILTLLESKGSCFQTPLLSILTPLCLSGLEFDDVLLYDFFTSSPASLTQWRIVNASSVRDLTKYRTIESELKRLYVAVTRARHHCWIWESTEVAIPMLVR